MSGDGRSWTHPSRRQLLQAAVAGAVGTTVYSGSVAAVSTPELLWKYEIPSGDIIDSTVLNERVLFAGSDTMYCLDTESRSQQWTFTIEGAEFLSVISANQADH
jgi:hypothetical protein